MWPCASALSRRPGSIPRPSSATSSSTRVADRAQRDRRPGSRPECRAALVSSSRATASTSSSCEVERVRVELDLDLEAALALGLARDRAERLLEPALLEGHRVQRQHRLAQALDRRRDHLVGALHLRPAGRRLDQLLVGGEQRLQRVVVDQLGDPPPALVLGLHHVGDQLAAGVELGLAAARPRRAGARSRRAASAPPAGAHYSSRPRRIASATAAARSETPSFS